MKNHFTLIQTIIDNLEQGRHLNQPLENLKLLIHFADLSHLSKSKEIALRTSKLVVQEFMK